MAQTYELCCDRCKVSLWFGQEVGGSVRVYASESSIEALGKFCFEHIGHTLRVLDSGAACQDYESVNSDDE